MANKLDGFDKKIIYNEKETEKMKKKSEGSARLPRYSKIRNEDIEDDPDNKEDLSFTADIENSINELGFTDPIEVLDLENGKYRILSGHRRRKAGVNCGLTEFPCIIIPSLKSDKDIRNYSLLSNLYRDSAKDPLMYSKRYQMHEAYLKSIDFKGAYREEIAKRLGISIPQADRYNRFNRIIADAWVLVREDKISMSGAVPMYNLSQEEQETICSIFLNILETEERIDREKCELIIREFKNKKSPEDILHKVMDKESSPVIPAAMESVPDKQLNAEPTQITDDDGDEDDDYDDEDEDEDEDTESDEDNPYNEAAEEAAATIQNLPPSLAHSLNNVNNTTQADSTRRVDETDNILGKKLEKSLEKISSYMDGNYKFSDEKTAKATIGSMLDIVSVMVTAIQDLSKKYNAVEYVTDLKSVIKSLLEQ